MFFFWDRQNVSEFKVSNIIFECTWNKPQNNQETESFGIWVKLYKTWKKMLSYANIKLTNRIKFYVFWFFESLLYQSQWTFLVILNSMTFLEIVQFLFLFLIRCF